jgi:DNA-binding MarR family transcriptional regulator
MSGTAAGPTELVSVDLGHALSSLLRRYLENARLAVVALPGGPRGFQLMHVVSRGAGSNQASIAEQLGLDRTVMTYLVDDLEKAGLVERRLDPADRRARRVVLTDQGAAEFAAASDRIRQVERAVLGDLSDDEAVVFRGLLARITAAAPVLGSTPCDPAEAVDC